MLLAVRSRASTNSTLKRDGEEEERARIDAHKLYVWYVAHGDASWNTADSHGISNEVDKIGRRGDHDDWERVCPRQIETEHWNSVR